jgi:hypothetical protein
VTLGQSDVFELRDAIRAAGDIDIVRKSVELVMQAVIDAEATEVIGTGAGGGDARSRAAQPTPKPPANGDG